MGGNRIMNIGLIAHDSKKKLMQNFCIAYRGILSKNELYATGTTGRLIEEVTSHQYFFGCSPTFNTSPTPIYNDKSDVRP